MSKKNSQLEWLIKSKKSVGGGNVNTDTNLAGKRRFNKKLISTMEHYKLDSAKKNQGELYTV